MRFYHRIIKIGKYYFIEKDRDQDFTQSYRERIPVPFTSLEEAKIAIDGFRSTYDDNYNPESISVVWEGE